MSQPPDNLITAAEYGRRQTPPIGKSGMSRLIADGLPVIEGRDDHGRKCKFVDPAEADLWRTANCTPKLDGNGQLRGLPAGPTPTGPATRDDGGPSRTEGARPVSAPPRSAPRAAYGSEGAGEDGLNRAERIAEAKAQAAEDDAATRRLKRLNAEGALVDRDVAIAVQVEFAAVVGKAVDRMAADMATHVATLVGCSEHAAYQALKDVAQKLRTGIARSADAAHERARALG